MIDSTFVEKIEELARKGLPPVLTEPTSVGEHGIPYMIMPAGEDGAPVSNILDVEKYLEAPVRKRADVVFTDAESFASYVNDHKDPGSVIFGKLAQAEFHAELDYHFPNKVGSTENPDGARWRDHSARLKLQKDPDWARWLGQNGKGLSQLEFAEFLEDMQHTIVEPQAAGIVEIVLKLQTTSEHAFESVVNRETGSGTLTYRENTQQVAGQVKMPTQMEISVRPFRSARPVNILVRIRFKVREGHVTFSYHLLRHDRVEEEAFQEIRERIEKATGLNPLLAL